MKATREQLTRDILEIAEAEKQQGRENYMSAITEGFVEGLPTEELRYYRSIMRRHCTLRKKNLKR